MLRKEVYIEAKSYLNGRWGNIVLMIILVNIVNSVISSLGSISTIGSSLAAIRIIVEGGDANSALEAIMSISTGFSIINFLIGVVTAVISAGLVMAILGAYQNQTKVTISNIVDEVKENFAVLMVASSILSVISLLIGLIPFAGSIINLILSYCFAFVYYLVKDKKVTDGVKAVTEGFNATNGRVVDLILIDLHYFLKPLIGFLVMMLGIFIMIAIDQIGLLIFFGGFVALIWLSILYAPYAYVAKVIYYNGKVEAVENESV